MFAGFFMQLSFLQSNKVKEFTPRRIFGRNCSQLGISCFKIVFQFVIILFLNQIKRQFIWQTGLICIHGKLSVILLNTYAIKMLKVHSSKVTFTYRVRERDN